jgi:Low-density lipoprotein receptor repeat class B
MYWTDAQRGIIERANMDGTERMILVDERRTVAVAGSSSSSNGTAATNETASATVRPHYYGIALDETYIYYTDWSRGWVIKLCIIDEAILGLSYQIWMTVTKLTKSKTATT